MKPLYYSLLHFRLQIKLMKTKRVKNNSYKIALCVKYLIGGGEQMFIAKLWLLLHLEHDLHINTGNKCFLYEILLVPRFFSPFLLYLNLTFRYQENLYFICKYQWEELGEDLSGYFRYLASYILICNFVVELV